MFASEHVDQGGDLQNEVGYLLSIPVIYSLLIGEGALLGYSRE